MTRPEDIPERVWAEATNEALAYIRWLGPVSLDSDADHVLTGSFARAILAAEMRVREECAAEMSAMRRDWCEFCEMIGVTVDTHEAVAELLMADRELIAEAKRLSAAIRKGGEHA